MTTFALLGMDQPESEIIDDIYESWDTSVDGLLNPDNMVPFLDKRRRQFE